MLDTCMTPEDQHFMATEGIITWAEAVIDQAEALSEWSSNVGNLMGTSAFHRERRRFQRNRHFILNAAWMLVQHRQWLSQIEGTPETPHLPSDTFSRLDAIASEIKLLRDKNEHVIEYSQGLGRIRSDWTHQSDDTGITDASSTFGSKIGGRLDWNELRAIAELLVPAVLSHLPAWRSLR